MHSRKILYPIHTLHHIVYYIYINIYIYTSFMEGKQIFITCVRAIVTRNPIIYYIYLYIYILLYTAVVIYMVVECACECAWRQKGSSIKVVRVSSTVRKKHCRRYYIIYMPLGKWRRRRRRRRWIKIKNNKIKPIYYIL